MTDKENLIAWLESEYVGRSPLTIVAVMENDPLLSAALLRGNDLRPPDEWWGFSLCARLLKDVPEYRPRLNELRKLSATWSALVDAWEQLEALLDEGNNAEVSDKIEHIISTHGRL